jgi:16S rRNA G527 N7-methylase RsmG
MVYDKILYKGDAMTSTLNDPWFKDEFHLTDNQLNQFETYYQYLVDQNQVMNLTAITEKIDVYRKHFLDSLWLLKGMPEQAKTLLDVGSGAGFPSFPIKIVKPIRVSLLSTHKKNELIFYPVFRIRLGLMRHSFIRALKIMNSKITLT